MNDMLQFFNDVRETFPPLFEYTANSIIMAFGSLGIVYFLGRMLNILKGDTSRNIVASIVMLAIGLFLSFTKYGMDYNFKKNVVWFIWDNFLYFSIACIIYVTVCFKLYSRIDSLLDKKIGKDKPDKNKKEKK